MRKLLIIISFVLSDSFIDNCVYAQNKIGYINISELVHELPEFKNLKSELEIYQRTFEDQFAVLLEKCQDEAKTTVQPKLNKVQIVVLEARLRDMQERIRNFQADVQQKVEAKSNELSRPLVDKAKAAVNDVAKEKGYNYVLDSSQGAVLIVSPAGDDLMDAAKAKLGIK